jgi:phospholipid/cholesterol/gamma-HCH transport system ATP-binding protein
MSEPVIDVKNLVAVYDDMIVLDGISFSVLKHEVFVVLGGSGCGKTTLLKHLLGLIKPEAGNINIFGTDITNINEDDIQPIRERIGMVFQGAALFNSMTLSENVALPLVEYTDYPIRVIQDIVDWKLHMVNLYHARDYLPSQLSGGMKKRAGIARAMVLDPELLFFDEHTTGLDPVMAAELDRTIVRLREELDITVVVVTHDMVSIRRIADRGIMLDKGSIIASGTLKEMAQSGDTRVINFFLQHEHEQHTVERKA